MDVQHATPEGGNDARRHQLQISGEHDKIYRVTLQEGEKRVRERGRIGKLILRDVDGRQTVGPGTLEYA
jgi:hypothetical protein